MALVIFCKIHPRFYKTIIKSSERSFFFFFFWELSEKKNHILMSREHLSGREGDIKFCMIKRGYMYYLSQNLSKERYTWDFKFLINRVRHVLYLVHSFRDDTNKPVRNIKTVWLISFNFRFIIFLCLIA